MKYSQTPSKGCFVFPQCLHGNLSIIDIVPSSLRLYRRKTHVCLKEFIPNQIYQYIQDGISRNGKNQLTNAARGTTVSRHVYFEG